jgi:oligopeptide/dipeptide ABC transporter ATP-binding protein
MTALVHAAAVSLRISNTAVLTDIDISVPERQTFAIVGESGCGKTMLARVLLMLQAPTEGEVRFRGEDLVKLPRSALRRQRRRMQMIFGTPYAALNPHMTIGEILGEPLVVHGIATWAGARVKVAEALPMVGLDPACADHTPQALSRGQRLRVAIARAVIAGPELVVADEPLAALDITEQGQILDLFGHLREMLGLTYIFISRDLPVVRHIADRAAVMLGGRIVEQGEPAMMFASPAHPYTQALLEAVPAPDPEREHYKMQTAGPPAGGKSRPGQRGACPFVDRCRHAFSLCGEIMPPLREVAPGWQAACWLLQR